MRCGCGLFSLIGLIPVLLVVALLLVAGSSMRALPAGIAGIGETLERGVATLLVGGTAGDAGLDIRAVEVKSREDGSVRLIVRAQLLDTARSADEAAAALAPALGDRIEGPLALARNVAELVLVIEDGDRVTLRTYSFSGSRLEALVETETITLDALRRLLDLRP